jgi:hypothetical protein
VFDSLVPGATPAAVAAAADASVAAIAGGADPEAAVRVVKAAVRAAQTGTLDGNTITD